MTLQRIAGPLVGLPSILLFTWTTLAVGQEAKKIDDKVLKAARKGTEWLSNGMDWGEQRYSTLTQINSGNVGKLALAWSYELGPGGGNQQATPLYSNGVLYTVTNWSIVAAVDATTGKEIWRYDPQADRTMTQPGKSRLCCGVNSRGIALYEGKVLVPVIDGRMQALDAATGKLLWSSWAIPEPKEGETSSYSLTMAARAAKGKVFIGNAGAEFPPFRGYVSAFDVTTGKQLWKFYTTPGDPSKGFENNAMEAAAKTWAGEWWKMGGGGSMWDGMAYDPDENLLYVGTGNGAVWSSDVRNGGRQTAPRDNLYIASILALNADTGQLKWHYQCTPGDEWDYDAIQHLLLADIRIGNRNRKVIMQANKNGYFYVIDRTNGEFISACEMSQVSWATGIDPKTGRPDVHPDAFYSSTKGVTVYPVQMHNTSQMSFNPNTGLVYVPIAVENTFSFVAAESYAPTPGSQNFGLNLGAARGGTPMASPPPHGPDRKNPDGSKVRGGILSAWDPTTQKERWFAPGGGQSGGGTLSLASNLVIQTLGNGHLKAFIADKGEQLLDVTLPLNSGTGPPMTYMLDGKQYIAVMAGTGAVFGRGGGRGAAGGPGRGAPPPPGAPLELTTAAAQGGNNVSSAPTAVGSNNNPKLLVYAVPN
ncbi:MAG TPA: PQQ-dependent dehydrogenase, methanol/ethanol family [Bryobacteraceae bacterium]|nr:PQQ-dependent dehydrogenase, methanol/ethanol family [Bryobacteraceae bacterium]